MSGKLLNGKVIVITGASRGIGRAIALRCAADGAKLVLAAKTSEPHPKLPGTIHSVADEVRAAGGEALPLSVDVRNEEQIATMMETAVKQYGVIDVLVNNAGAIQLTDTENTPAKKFDLMNQINTRATFLCSQAALAGLKRSKNAHIVSLSPPLNLNPKWLAPHIAYTISKYGMTLCTLGMAAEFKSAKISVNSLWPRKLIGTAATRMLLGDKAIEMMRTPQIMADAVYEIITTPGGELTGQTLIDEDFLRSRRYTDFSIYEPQGAHQVATDIFVDS